MNPFKYLLLIIPIAIAAWTTKKSDENITVQTINCSVISNEVRFIDVWYEYIGPNTSSGRSDSFNYIRMIPQPTVIAVYCPGREVLCAVRLPDSGMYPRPLTSYEITAIESAVFTQLESDDIQLRLSDW